MFETLERRCLCSGGTAASSADVAGAVADTGARQVINLDVTWRFKKGDFDNAEKSSFSDSSWQTVVLPHTWNAADGSNGDDNYYRGVGWYRRTINVPATLAGDQFFLEFEGASTAAEVFVNGHELGSHEGAFATFRFNATQYLVPGQDNVIAVRVDNADDRSFAPIEGAGVTLGGPDFTIFGGLYRDVSLVATPPVHVSLSDFGSPGVKVDQKNVGAASASVIVHTRIDNG